MGTTTTAKATCIGNHGQCGKTVLARGMCRAHYYGFMKGRDIDRPLRSRDDGQTEQTVPPRVTPAVKKAIQAACEAMGISEYEFHRRLIQDWYESWERNLPGANRNGPKLPAVR